MAQGDYGIATIQEACEIGDVNVPYGYDQQMSILNFTPLLDLCNVTIDIPPSVQYSINQDQCVKYIDLVKIQPPYAKFNLNGYGDANTCPPAQINLTIGDYITRPNSPIDSSGQYIFNDWYDNPECTGNAWSFYNTPITQSITVLYAKWVKIGSNCTISFSSGLDFIYYYSGDPNSPCGQSVSYYNIGPFSSTISDIDTSGNWSEPRYHNGIGGAGGGKAKGDYSVGLTKYFTAWCESKDIIGFTLNDSELMYFDGQNYFDMPGKQFVVRKYCYYYKFLVNGNITFKLIIQNR